MCSGPVETHTHCIMLAVTLVTRDTLNTCRTCTVCNVSSASGGFAPRPPPGTPLDAAAGLPSSTDPLGPKNQRRHCFEDIFIRFNRMHECDGWIDGLTDTARQHRSRLCIASRQKLFTDQCSMFN